VASSECAAVLTPETRTSLKLMGMQPGLKCNATNRDINSW
jgi:hypothetical protein